MVLGGPDPSGDLALLRTAVYAGNPTGSVVDGAMRLGWASVLFAKVMVQDARKDISERFVPWPLGKAVVGTRFQNAPMGPAAGWQAFGCVSIRSARPIRGMRLAARRSGVRFCGEAKATFPGTGQGSGRREARRRLGPACRLTPWARRIRNLSAEPEVQCRRPAFC